MADIGVTDIVILGSTTVVSTSVYNQCAAYAGGTDHVLRVAGANRYETAKEVASWASDLKGPGVRDDNAIGTVANPAGLSRLYVDNLGLASGENFPDALSGGVLCGCTRHPILSHRSRPSLRMSTTFTSDSAGKTDFYTDAGQRHRVPAWVSCSAARPQSVGSRSWSSPGCSATSAGSGRSTRRAAPRGRPSAIRVPGVSAPGWAPPRRQRRQSQVRPCSP